MRITEIKGPFSVKAANSDSSVTNILTNKSYLLASMIECIVAVEISPRASIWKSMLKGLFGVFAIAYFLSALFSKKNKTDSTFGLGTRSVLASGASALINPYIPRKVILVLLKDGSEFSGIVDQRDLEKFKGRFKKNIIVSVMEYKETKKMILNKIAHDLPVDTATKNALDKEKNLNTNNTNVGWIKTTLLFVFCFIAALELNYRSYLGSNYWAYGVGSWLVIWSFWKVLKTTTVNKYPLFKKLRKDNLIKK